MAVVLLVQTSSEVLALTFTNAEAAREFEDRHELSLPGTVIGVARKVSHSDALLAAQ